MKNSVKTTAVIEFGTSKVIVMVAQSTAKRIGSDYFEIIGAGIVSYDGFEERSWLNREKLDSVIEEAIKTAQTDAKVIIDSIYVGVPGDFIHVSSQEHGIRLTDDNGKALIVEKDIARFMDEAAEKLDLANEGGHVLHRSPAWYRIDNGKRTMMVVNSRGKDLTGEISFIQADPDFVEEIRSILSKLGIQVEAFLSPSLGMSQYLIDFAERDRHPCVLIDTGYRSCEISVCEGDAITAHLMLPIGGCDITDHLMDEFDIDRNSAERIKQACKLNPEDYEKAEVPSVLMPGGHMAQLDKGDVHEVIDEKMSEIADYIRQAFDYIDGGLDASAKVYMTGGGVCPMNGAAAYFARELDRPVKLVKPKGCTNYEDYEYSSAVGLVDMVFNILDGIEGIESIEDTSDAENGGSDRENEDSGFADEKPKAAKTAKKAPKKDSKPGFKSLFG